MPSRIASTYVVGGRAAACAASAMPMPEGDSATDRLFADEPALLEDGASRWSGF